MTLQRRAKAGQDDRQRQASAIPGRTGSGDGRFFTCEMTTIGKSGRPVTWPVMLINWTQCGQFVMFTSIGLPQKAFNVRQNPRVSLLFSDPTGIYLFALHYWAKWRRARRAR